MVRTLIESLAWPICCSMFLGPFADLVVVMDPIPILAIFPVMDLVLVIGLGMTMGHIMIAEEARMIRKGMADNSEV